jgi:enoyl-CoA hydratase/carnithine racemase
VALAIIIDPLIHCCFDRDVHPRKAKEIMMLQRFVLAAEAQELGIINRVVPRAELMAEAVATAGLLAGFDSFRACRVLGHRNNYHAAGAR